MSIGELIDKITILAIKSRRIQDDQRLDNVLRELAALEDVAQATGLRCRGDLEVLEQSLMETNEALWDIEDAIRDCERRGSFGLEFIELARSVYRTNDRRAEIKMQINRVCGSLYIEEKNYTPY